MKILVIAAHPDDEVLGCGASIAKWSQSGDEVHVLILAEGATSREPLRNRMNKQSELSALAQAAYRAGEILGVASVTLQSFPDNRMDSVDRLDVIKSIEGEIARLKPEMIVTHHVGDVNIDHRITHDAVVTACRPLPGFHVHRLLAFEVPSSTEWQVPGSAPLFQPNWFEDVTTTFLLKMSALEAYAAEMRPWPHPRSLNAVEYLARWRGASIGIDYVEAFQLMRELR
ncbi:MAG: PIG-L family deacetylase [SAR324 cluster bacterium]|nr:PIG-L family deacetylase [SAR324 cluster bacterium]